MRAFCLCDESLCAEHLHCPSQAIMVDGVVLISQDYAKEAFGDKWELHRFSFSPEEKVFREQARAKSNLLLELNKKLALLFLLHEAVEGVSASGEGRPFHRSRRL